MCQVNKNAEPQDMRNLNLDLLSTTRDSPVSTNLSTPRWLPYPINTH